MNVDKMIKKQKVENNSIVREKLMTQKDIVFTCGHKDALGRIQEYKVYASDRSDVMSYAITENTPFGKMMNVNKFGPTCVTLYTFDMLHNRTSGKIKYKDIKFVEPKVKESNPLEKLPDYMGTEKGNGTYFVAGSKL
tara:strand:- start:712 stop:1122 length:411 start_codon:yes stop_codon:yes gene_type:complete